MALADSFRFQKPTNAKPETVGSHTSLDNMGSKSGEQVRDEMVEKLGHDFGRLLNSLYNEISWLTFKWIEFRELYGTKESRFDIMNKTAPIFFSTIQKVLWENLLLGVARITDPPDHFSWTKLYISVQELGKFKTKAYDIFYLRSCIAHNWLIA